MSTAAVEYCPFLHNCDLCEYDCEETYKMNYKIINIQHDKGVALVKRNTKAFPVKLCTYTKKGTPSVGDYAKVVKSPVSGEWLLVDYIAMFGGGDF